MIDVQKPVAFKDSIAVELSNLVWEYGLGAFFVDRVPFSGRSGKLFASRLAKFFVAHVRAHFSEWIDQKKTLNVIEFGAGTGLLAKHFMDYVKAIDTEVYDLIVLWITDVAEQPILKLQNISILYEHVHQLRVEVLDALNLEQSGLKDVVFAFSSYLLSSFPMHHIQIENGKAYEMQVRTQIEKTAKVIDTSLFLPEILDADALKELISGFNRERKKMLAGKIKPLLKEKHEKDELKAEDKTDFILKMEQKNDQWFNYSEAISDHIQAVMNLLEPNGVYLTSDFDVATVDNEKDGFIKTDYGVTVAASICIDQIADCADKNQWTSFVTAHKQNPTQEIALVKTSDKQVEFEAEFHDAFDNIGTEKMESYIQELIKYDAEELDLKWLEGQIKTLSENELHEYPVLKVIINLYVQYGFYQEAMQYASVMSDVYGELGIDALMNIGWICQQNQVYDMAEDSFKQALTVCDNASGIYAGLGAVYMMQNKVDDYMKYFRLAIKYLRDDQELWQYLAAIGTGYKKKGDIKKAKAIYQWPLKVAKNHDGMVPQDIVLLCKNEVSRLTSDF
jgi:tetratricopeptide (TPR) repeat protein